MMEMEFMNFWALDKVEIIFLGKNTNSLTICFNFQEISPKVNRTVVFYLLWTEYCCVC